MTSAVKPNTAFISVIMWDASFRERFNAFMSLTDQTLARECYEVIYVDYFARIPPMVRAASPMQAQVVTLKRLFPWHAGQCVNAGIARARGDLIVVIDADVVVARDFLEQIAATFADKPDLMAHVRRWDEPYFHRGHLDWEQLSAVCILSNPENYGGCLVARRESLRRVNGCDEQPIFQRDSAVFRDLHVRLLNTGIEHTWLDPLKLLHPWHPGTSALAEPSRLRMQMELIGARRANRVVRANPACDALAMDSRPSIIALAQGLAVFAAAKADGLCQRIVRRRVAV